MGCASSKRLDNDVVARPAGVAAGTSSEPPSKRRYSSDIHADKPSHASSLVHESTSMGDFEKKYDLSGGTELGRGACGQVCTVRNRHTSDLFAMKTVSVTDMGSWDDLRNEIELQKGLDHPNICKILEAFEDKRNGEVFIIMEMCTGGSLVSRMRTHRNGYGEEAAATLVEKMLSAIMYCHHHGVVHRDIKLDNMIYEDEREDAELKLIDFGFAKGVQPGAEIMWDQLGTPSYMAPELWSERESAYDSSVDMWALGVVAYMLLSGQRPFHSADKREKARMIRHDPLRFPEKQWAHISQDAQEFCSALMKKKPSERLSASEAVKHPWITKRSQMHSGVDAASMLQRHEDIVESLQAFSEADDLKKLALEVIAFSTPPSKLEELRSVFQKIDIDDSGTIDLDEFKKAMAAYNIPQDRLEYIFDKMDVSHNGEGARRRVPPRPPPRPAASPCGAHGDVAASWPLHCDHCCLASLCAALHPQAVRSAVDYTEFLAATVSSQSNMVARGSIKAAFTTLDRDGDGYITLEDLHSALEGVPDAQLSTYLRHADESGRVSFQNFKKTIMHELASPSFADAEGHIQRLSNFREATQHVQRAKSSKLLLPAGAS